LPHFVSPGFNIAAACVGSFYVFAFMFIFMFYMFYVSCFMFVHATLMLVSAIIIGPDIAYW